MNPSAWQTSLRWPDFAEGRGLCDWSHSGISSSRFCENCEADRVIIKSMKRAWAAAAVVLAATLAGAQTRGVPPSVTSITPFRSFTVPVAPSVTSLGPYGLNSPCSSNAAGPLIPSAMGCTDPAFTSPFIITNGQKPVNTRPRRHRPIATAYVPYYIPYPLVANDASAYSESSAYSWSQAPAEAYAAEPDPPAPTVFERRPAVQYIPTNVTPVAKAEPDPRPQTPTVLIFRDGHQVEVLNYAILGNTLYNLSGFTAQKILLAQLDLPATIKANDERGVEFSLPSSAKLQ